MGAIKDNLKSSLNQIFADLDPDATAEQKAEKIAAAFEQAILQGLKVQIIPGMVMIPPPPGSANPAPIDCQLSS